MVLGLFAALVFVFSSGAHAYSVDEITNYASARAFVETGNPDLSGDQPFSREQLLTVSHSSTGRVVGKYGLGSWVAISPAYGVAKWLGSVAPPPSSVFPQPSTVRPIAVLLYNPVIAAVLVSVTFLLGRALGLRLHYAFLASLILAFASPLWVYAKGLSNIPLASLLISAGFVSITRSYPRGWHWAAAGLFAGLAAVTRPELVLVAPVLGVLAIRPETRLTLSGSTRALVYTAVWAAVAIPGIGLWNLYRTGAFLGFGYQPSILWQTDRAYIGVFGVLASPSFGLLVFMPAAAFGLWGLLNAKEYTGIWRAMCVLVAIACVGYGSFEDWWGGVSWGSRYLTIVTPFLALGLGLILQASSTTRIARVVILGLVMWSAGLSVLGSLFDYQSGWRNLWDHGARFEQIVWDPHFSIIGAHLRLARQWVDGFIGPDLYMAHVLGPWSVAVFSVSFLAVVWIAVAVETYGRVWGKR